MSDDHKEALRILGDGLCRIREASLRAPEYAYKLADALHNVPDIIAEPRRGDETYLKELLLEARRLLDDESWRHD